MVQRQFKNYSLMNGMIFLRRLKLSLFVIFAALTVSNADAQNSINPTLEDLLAEVAASGWADKPHRHPRVKAYLRETYGPRLAPSIKDYKEKFNTEIKFEFGEGNQTRVFKPYTIRPILLLAIKQSKIGTGVTTGDLLDSLVDDVEEYNLPRQG